MTISSSKKNPFILLAAPILLTFWGLALGSGIAHSPTFDEGFYIGRGWAFIRSGTLSTLGHPPLANLISGLGVLLEPGLPHPTSLPGWEEGDAERLSEALLWENNLNVVRIVFLARVPVIFLGILLGGVIWRWGRDLYGPWAAFFALLLYALSPNILAHTSLATTDLPVAAFYVAALYTWSRYLKNGKGIWLASAGLLTGFAQASKFSALLLLPTLGLMTISAAYRQSGLSIRGWGSFSRWFERVRASKTGWFVTAIVVGFLWLTFAILALWASHLFTLQPLSRGMYIGELQHFLELAQEGHQAYLLGRFSETGWWYYHLVTLGVKLPETTLLLLIVAVIFAVGRGLKPEEWNLLFPALVYLGFTLLISLNVGIRYLLPSLVLLLLFISRLAWGKLRSGPLRPAILGFFGLGNLIITLLVYPHFIPYFNWISGGPDRGLQILADSNLDWGQDLPALSRYLAERGNPPIYLSYFGQADPSYYGINALPLPAWPPPVQEPDFNPLNPAPGLYAISASNLIGLTLFDPNSFGYFRARQPLIRLGHSIYIYEVPPDAAPAGWLAQCADEPLETDERLSALSGIENPRVIYFVCENSLPIPEGSGWILLPEEISPVAELGEPTFLARFPDGKPRYSAWWVKGGPPPPDSRVDFPLVSLPLPVADHLDLLGYQISANQLGPGDVLTLTAWWRVRKPPPPPVSIFAHILTPDGFLVQAGDALGVAAEEWQSGMIIIQQHSFTIPAELAPGDYTLTLGLYSLLTNQRFPLAQSEDRVVDRIVLRTIQVTER